MRATSTFVSLRILLAVALSCFVDSTVFASSCAIESFQLIEKATTSWNGSCNTSGRAEGIGRITWRNDVGGELANYEGAVANGFMTGSGRLAWQDGAAYDGQWIGNLPDGFGTLEFSSEHSLSLRYSTFTIAPYDDRYDLNPNNQDARWSSDSKRYVLRGLFRKGVFLASCDSVEACTGLSPVEGMFSLTYLGSDGVSKYDKDLDGKYFSEKRYEWRDTSLDATVRLEVVKTPAGISSSASKTMQVCNEKECREHDGKLGAYIGPQPIRLFKDSRLTEPLHDIPLAYAQWDEGRAGKFSTAGAGISRHSNALLIDPDTETKDSVRVRFLCRSADVLNCFEPISGYIAKRFVLRDANGDYIRSLSDAIKLASDTIKSNNDHYRFPRVAPARWNELLDRLNPSSVSKLPRVASPYNAAFDYLDIRRKLELGRAIGLEEYGFLKVISSKGSGCSGALVGDQSTVVTAGHCLKTKNDNVIVRYVYHDAVTEVPGKVIDTPYFDLDSMRLKAATNAKTEYKNGRQHVADWAVIKLDRPLPKNIKPIQVADYGKVLSGENYPQMSFAVGFPADIDSDQPILSPCGPIDIFGSRITFSDNTDWMAAIHTGKCLIFQGNSGGPLLVLKNGEPQFVGVLSQSEQHMALLDCPDYYGSDTSDIQIADVFGAYDRLGKDDQGRSLFDRQESNSLSSFDKEMLERAAKLKAIDSRNPVMTIIQTSFDSYSKTDKKDVCKFKKFVVPLLRMNFDAVFTASKWMLDTIAQVSGKSAPQTITEGVTVFSNPVTGTLIHTYGRGLKELLPQKLGCLHRTGSEYPETNGSVSKLLLDDGFCDVSKKARSAFRLSKYQAINDVGFAAYHGNLLVFDRRSNDLLATYYGVIERCLAERFMCQMHIVLPALNGLR
jgi:hypothetical protein